MEQFKLPKLPYALDALAPQISEETMSFHYEKHHAAYVSNLNNLIENTEFQQKSLKEIVKTSSGAIFNNAAQHFNHILFFLSLSPNPQAKPTGGLMEAIEKQFGSYDEMIEAFIKAASTHFGSGWAWLATDAEGKLSILATINGDNPLTHELEPLMGIDVWEHAYYIDYRNLRANYIKAYLERLDWAVVESTWKESTGK